MNLHQSRHVTEYWLPNIKIAPYPEKDLILKLEHGINLKPLPVFFLQHKFPVKMTGSGPVPQCTDSLTHFRDFLVTQEQLTILFIGGQ